MQFTATEVTKRIVSQGSAKVRLLLRDVTHGHPQLSALALAATLGWVASAQAPPDFEQVIKPVLAGKCYACHSGGTALGGIRLDAKAGAMGHGDSGQPTIVPGDSDASELIRRITSKEKSVRMPLVGDPLAPDEIAVLRAWIDGGAVWPESEAGHEVSAEPGERIINDRDREHWAYRPLANDRPPAVRANGWARNPIDAFVLARLEEQGIAPSPEAERRTLVRRVYYGLLGLPPAPAEIDAFVNDSSPNAYDVLIDRLLSNPHYGERWGRHWLDVARYADSEGYENDYDRLTMYRYRDFVIRALNDDMPFDQFVRWQIAGDEYEPDNPKAVIATGFLAAGPRAHRSHRLQGKQRALSLRRVGRPGQDNERCHAWPDRRLRALPRPQIRRDPNEGLLPHGSGLPQLRPR
jgi:hypothetical protein